MRRVRTFLCGLSLFYVTFWLPVAAAVYTPFWYDISCTSHGRCAHLGEELYPALVRELTSYLTHTGSLRDAGWTLKERRHLAEARDRLDLATLTALIALLILILDASFSGLKRGASANLVVIPLMTCVFPFFSFFWRGLFHPLLFSNNRWLNTPLDHSFYLMPRPFFVCLIAYGLAVAWLVNAFLCLWVWRRTVGNKSTGQSKIGQIGGSMKRIGWMALGGVLGVLVSMGYRMVTDDGAVPASEVQVVVAEKQASMGEAVAMNDVGGQGAGGALSGGDGDFAPDMDLLRESLPGNLAIPPRGVDERWMRSEAKKERNELFGRINANVASEVELHSYYEEQQLITQDSIVMLEWILNEYGTEMGEGERAKHTFLLDQFKKRLGAIPSREARALQRLKDKEGIPDSAVGQAGNGGT